MSDTFDKQAVLDSFTAEVNSYLPEIETNLERLTLVPGDMDALEETYRRVHTIGGSASMMDFPGLAHVAHGMEDILGDALDGLTTLNEVTIDILRRSFGRLKLLLEGIRSGINEGPIIEEDDADYARYRAAVDSVAQPSQSMQSAAPQEHAAQYQQSSPSYQPEQPPAQPQEAFNQQPPTTPRYFEEVAPPAPATTSSSTPSLEEVLNSFRTPSVMPGDDLDWPEDPPASSHVQEQNASYWPATRVEEPPAQNDIWSSQTFQPSTAQPSSSWSSSALEELMASTRSSSAPLQPPAPPPTWDYADAQSEDLYSPPSIAPQEPAPEQAHPGYPVEIDSQTPAPTEPQGAWQQGWNSQDALPPLPTQDAQPFQPAPAEIEESPEASDLPAPYSEARREAEALEAQVTSLRDITNHMRSAISIIEAQRSEFKGFLDGSKDALDRMEDWAGKAMGLNLRKSPEQVRRYLPLSVMWVANSKLKKVLDLLRQIIGGVELSDEQLTAILQQLQASLDACGDAFRDAQDQASLVLQQEPGWSSWQMQQDREPGELRERVTFERQGDPEALRAQIRAELETELRDEISKEYDERPLPLAARAEIEQQIRSEVRQEFEMRRRLQESVGPEREDILKELEARLRSEIEIQVRQEFLNQLHHVGGDVALALQSTTPTVPGATQMPPPAPAAMRQPAPPPAPPAPPPAPAPSSFGDFGEEAAEIFRTEAEEHLQTISMHVAELEKDQGNRDLIQGIRRATHTLKGAAGMMGFRAIADLCHVSEDLLDSIMEGTMSITSAVLSIILDTAETLDVLITGRATDGLSDEARVQILRNRYVELLGERGAGSIAAE
ncbi:MAG: Hpt domain-containing protein, partial [Ktedonobacteraceae bacterium]|nr:Hpt domain-containing protein [Ktedonobacteraceae bacterium]